MKSERFNCADPEQLLEGMRKARMAIGRGKLVVVPTDTGYAVVADAFRAQALEALRDARGMPEQAPLGVFVPGIPTLRALSEEEHPELENLVKEFWPGGLSIIVAARESLAWDLGLTKGTVALRMPSNRFTLELLSETGPLASSQASAVGQPPVGTVQEAKDQLGDSVAVYLADDASVSVEEPSTILDSTGLDRPQGRLRLLRVGAIPALEIHEIVSVERFA